VPVAWPNDMPIRIAFDGRSLIGPRTGVGVWLEGLLRGLAGATDWRFVLCLPRPAALAGLDDLADRVAVLAPRIPLPGTLWLHTLAAPMIAESAEVYVATLGVLPRRLAVPNVLVVHDLTPRSHPAHHTAASRFCFNAYFEESLARADALVCISQATRAAVGKIVPDAGRRACVIAAGVDPYFSPSRDEGEAAETRRRFAGGRPFVVQLGTLEPRKGIATLLAAHGELLGRAEDAPDLVLAGARGWGRGWVERALAQHPARSRVHLTGYVEREEARALLRAAEAAVLASEEEGFGLPLAEALACGTACVASDAPALVEVAGGAARHFAKGDARALAAALSAALVPETRRALQAAALRRAPALGRAKSTAAWRELLGAVAHERSGELRMRGDAATRD
jgi:glycosyltransferase involved in cell wall biosynthesis